MGKVLLKKKFFLTSAWSWIRTECSRRKVFLSFPLKTAESRLRKVLLRESFSWRVANSEQEPGVVGEKVFLSFSLKKTAESRLEKVLLKKSFSGRVADSEQEPSALEEKFFSVFLWKQTAESRVGIYIEEKFLNKTQLFLKKIPGWRKVLLKQSFF